MKKISIQSVITVFMAILIVSFQNFTDSSGLSSRQTATADVEKYSFNDGGEFPGASGSLHRVAPTSGDSIILLNYDFTGGGNYVAAQMKLATPVVADTVRFRLNVPLQSLIYLRVTDETKQTLQFIVNHSNLISDDTGWTTVELPVTTSTSHWGGTDDGTLHGRIVSLSVGIGNSKRNPENLVGQGLISNIQIYNKNNFTVTTGSNELSAFHFSNGAEFPGATGSMEVIPERGGDSILVLDYNFKNGGNYVGARMQLASPVDGHFVRFSFRADSQMLVGLRVKDDSDQTLQKIVPRHLLTVDEYGWANATIDMGSSNSFWGGAKNGLLQGHIKTVELLIDHSSIKGASGTAYFRQVEILSHFPSMYDSTVSPVASGLKSVTFSDGSEFPGASGSMKITSANDESIHAISYNLTKGNYVADVMAIANPIAANEVRFLAKFPKGVDIGIRVQDSAGQTFQTDFINRNFDSLQDDGWRSFVIPLGNWALHFGGPNDGVFRGGITHVSIVVDVGPQGRKNSVLTISPTGTFYVKNLSLGNSSPSHIDLKPSTITYPAMGKINSNPVLTTGVCFHSRTEATYTTAQEIGFRYARTDVNWGGLEKEKGVYRTTSFVTAVDSMNAHGITPVLILDYSNPLYPPVGDLPIDLAAFQRYVAAVTTAMKGKNVIFEVWNEEDLWGFTPQQYAKVLAATSKTIHSLDANRLVISGGLAGANYPYIYRILAETIPTGIAAFSIHPYTHTNAEKIADRRAAILDMISSFGLNAKLATTEVGASSYWYDTKDPKSDVAENYHATTITRQVLTSWASGEALTLIYQLQDSTFDPNKSKPQEYFFGLVGPKLEEKPAKKAVKFLLHTARVRTYQGVVSGSTLGLQAMKFAAPQKETVYVVWNNIRKSQATFTAVDNCDKSIDFSGAKASQRTSCFVDHQQQPLSCIRNSNGTSTCSISEAQGPVFVRMRN